MTSLDVAKVFSPAMVRACLLGPVAVSISERPVRLKPREQLLMAALLWAEGDVVSNETLQDRLQTDRMPTGGRGWVQDVARGLREALDEAWPGARDLVVTESGGGYSVNLTADQVDATRFRRLVSDAYHSDKTLNDQASAVELYGEALSLWGHDPASPPEPIANLRGTWAEGVRQGLRSGQLGAVTEWARLKLHLRRDGDLLPVLDQLVTVHTLDERIAELRMRALCRAGRRAEAQEFFRAFGQRLRDETGKGAGEPLRRLYENANVEDMGAGPSDPEPAEQPSVLSGEPSPTINGTAIVSSIGGKTVVVETDLAGRHIKGVAWADRVEPGGELTVVKIRQGS